MGVPKATLPFGPETMLQRVVRVLGGVVAPIVVVAARDQQQIGLDREIKRNAPERNLCLKPGVASLYPFDQRHDIVLTDRADNLDPVGRQSGGKECGGVHRDDRLEPACLVVEEGDGFVGVEVRRIDVDPPFLGM